MAEIRQEESQVISQFQKRSGIIDVPWRRKGGNSYLFLRVRSEMRKWAKEISFPIVEPFLMVYIPILVLDYHIQHLLMRWVRNSLEAAQENIWSRKEKKKRMFCPHFKSKQWKYIFSWRSCVLVFWFSPVHCFRLSQVGVVIFDLFFISHRKCLHSLFLFKANTYFLVNMFVCPWLFTIFYTNAFGYFKLTAQICFSALFGFISYFHDIIS